MSVTISELTLNLLGLKSQAQKIIDKEKKLKEEYIDLESCGLTSLEKQIPELFELTWLKGLILSSLRNYINGGLLPFDRWPNDPKIGDIFYTNKANHPNTLRVISPLFLRLKKLDQLLISWNKIYVIENLPQSISMLDISNNNIVYLNNLPTNLKRLYIYSNKIRKLKNLPKGLIELNIASNQIKKLENLPESLNKLDIGSNQIYRLENLPNNLTLLDISDNPIEDLSPILHFIKRGLPVYWDWERSWEKPRTEGIYVKECPLTNPPIEIVKQGNQAILNYFRQLDEEQGQKKFLFEVKLLIIGEQGAGKTTFSRRIQKKDAPMPGEGDSTHGINVDRWEFDVPVGTFKEINHRDASFHVNLWDFGGQEVYHGTHQFFFSKKSLYVLLCDTREQKTDFRYWLNTVEQLCGEDAHLFILFNRREDHDWQLDAGFRDRFKQLIKEEYSLDLSIVESIPELQRRIKSHLQRLPDVGQKLIQSWVDIREDLAKEMANDISFDRFVEICAAHNRTRPEDIENISRYFTRIGVFTHYIDDLVLRERVYLNSNHLVKTIYQLLDNAEIKAFGGRIGKKEIERVWEKLGFEKERLPRLLEKFGLMYEVPKQAKYIIPEHLPDGAPYVHWEHEKAMPQLHFRYEFDKYMPKGLMSRLIVALHRYIADHSQVWRRGVNLSHGSAHAEITESLGGVNRFDIRIVGDFRRDLLVIITHVLDHILSDFQKLSVSREVQCPCEECQKSGDPYFHKIKDIEQALIKKAGKSNPTVECKVSYDDVEILKLLGMVNFEWVLQRTEERGREMGVHLELQNIKDELQQIKQIASHTNLMVNNIHKDLLANYFRLENELSHISGQIFDSTQEEKMYFQKIEQRLTPTEKAQVPWHDNDIKHKIKVTLPLLFVKYEAEMEVSNFELPKTWTAFKRWFIKDA